MQQPTPDHPVTIAPNPKRVRVIFNGRVIANSHRRTASHQTGAVCAFRAVGNRRTYLTEPERRDMIGQIGHTAGHRKDRRAQ
mgnify:CR=1 FL=1